MSGLKGKVRNLQHVRKNLCDLVSLFNFLFQRHPHNYSLGNQCHLLMPDSSRQFCISLSTLTPSSCLLTNCVFFILRWGPLLFSPLNISHSLMCVISVSFIMTLTDLLLKLYVCIAIFLWQCELFGKRNWVFLFFVSPALKQFLTLYRY